MLPRLSPSQPRNELELSLCSQQGLGRLGDKREGDLEGEEDREERAWGRKRGGRRKEEAGEGKEGGGREEEMSLASER